MSYSSAFRGLIGRGSSRQLQTGYQNASGSTLAQATPITINGSSQLVGVDVSSSASANKILGLCSTSIPNSASGEVVDHGRLENVSVGFSVGDALYVSKAGFLTNVVPSVGVGGFVAGDWVVFVGVVVKNEFNNLQLDIVISIQVRGVLG